MQDIKSHGIKPIVYNIILTRDGAEIAFPFPPPTVDMVAQFGFCTPSDGRCRQGLIYSVEELQEALAPVLGKAFHGELLLPPRKQVIISLHNASILGYQRQAVIDPRLSNEIAILWQIYLDKRVFPKADETAWQLSMAQVIRQEMYDDQADEALAEDLKNRLIAHAKELE